MGNSAEMDRQNYQMTDSRNVFCRFFYILVMLHKIMHSHYPPRIAPAERHSVRGGGARRVCASGIRLSEGRLLRRVGAGFAADGHSLGISG